MALGFCRSIAIQRRPTILKTESITIWIYA